MNYSIRTEKTWERTMIDLRETFAKWGIDEWDVEGTKRQRDPEPKVTVWFDLRGRKVTLPLGSQERAVDNFRAIYLTIEGMRMADKRGLTELTAKAYAQLEGPMQMRDPFEVLGIRPDADQDVIEAAYKVKAKRMHPDHGGSTESFQDLQHAREAALSG